MSHQDCQQWYNSTQTGWKNNKKKERSALLRYLHTLSVVRVHVARRSDARCLSAHGRDAPGDSCLEFNLPDPIPTQPRHAHRRAQQDNR